MKALYYCAGENEKIVELYKYLFPAQKDYTKYYVGDINDLFTRWKRNDLLDKNRLIFKIIESYSDKVSSNIIDLQNAFPESLRKMTNAPAVLSYKKSNKYKKVDKHNIFIHQSAWDGTTLIRHVISHVSKVFPEFGTIIEIPYFICKRFMY